MAVNFHPLPLDVFPEEARPAIARLNAELRNLFALEGAISTTREPTRRSDSSIARNQERQVHLNRITPSLAAVVAGTSVVVGTPNLTFGTVNAAGTTNTAIAVDSSIALFANPSVLLGLTAINGSAGTALRSDAAPALDQSISPTWTGVHTWSPSANSTPVTVNSVGTAQTVNIFTVAHIGNSAFEINREGRVGVNYPTMGGVLNARAGLGGGATSIEPDQLTNLEIWLRTDDITGVNDGDQFVAGQQWTDRSSNAYAFEKEGTAATPRYNASDSDFNNRPTIEQVTANGVLREAGDATISISGDFTVIAVYAGPGGGGSAFIIGEHTGTTNERGCLFPNNLNSATAQFWSATINGTAISDNFDNSSGVAHISVIRRGGDTANELTLYHDGSTRSKSGGGPTDASDFEWQSLFRVDANSTAGVGTKLAELIVFSDYKTDAEVAQLHNYMATRYNLTTVANDTSDIFQSRNSADDLVGFVEQGGGLIMSTAPTTPTGRTVTILSNYQIQVATEYIVEAGGATAIEAGASLIID